MSAFGLDMLDKYAELTANSVPISKLPQLAYDTLEDIKASGIKSTIVGHAGDGLPLLR